VALRGQLMAGLRSRIRRALPEPRFVIFAQGRTGSSLLAQLLDSHPRIRCEGELLARGHRFPPGRRRSALRYLEGRSAAFTGRAYGFKVKIYQLREDQEMSDPGAFLSALHARGWRILHLRRQDLLRQVLSNLVAEERGAWHLEEGDHEIPMTPLVVAPEVVLEGLARRRAHAADEEAALGGIPRLELVYERDLLDPARHQATADRVCAWLGLPAAPVRSRLRRINRGRLRELVANHEALVAALRGSDFTILLDGEDPPG
jgi:LPS sulfotransferase NodH